MTKAMSTDDLDFDKLRRVAEAATPGPWAISSEEIRFVAVYSKVRSVGVAQCEEYVDGEFIATFNPVLVLRLLDLAQQAGVMREENQRLRFLLWEHHAHEGKYGDDGEIQCQGSDFKRDPLERIEIHLVRAALAPTTRSVK